MRHFIFIFLIGLSVSTQTFAKSTHDGNTISKTHIVSMENYCHEMINQVRIEHGMKPLKYESQLANCAREHSQDMALKKVPFGHQGFETRAKKMRKVASFLSMGENVAYSYNYSDHVAIAVEGWMKSQGHKENILGDFEETGIGIAFNDQGECYVTQLFAKRRQQTKYVKKP